MLAVVKTPHIEVRIKGSISAKMLDFLRREYGHDLTIHEPEEDDSAVPFKESEWYQTYIKRETPGDILNAIRWQRRLSQAELARRLGIARQSVSAMEKGRRAIGPDMIARLAQVLGVSPDEFIPGDRA
ncbi:MAG: helix-turn-helix domain-containing protein [Desulfobulbaceae bacterium]|jgi:DNA-binding XRE family transcriptional regulator|nr:helix-turn-helix domain-containing protein [Desulfobulbaceae bacterium]